MMEDFRPKAARHVIQLGPGLTLSPVNLSFILITDAQTEEGKPPAKEISLSGDVGFVFGQAEVETVKAGLQAFNAAGGNYFWLAPNLAVNLDVISGVACSDKKLSVLHPGGVWTSAATEKAEEYYASYRREIERQNQAVEPKVKTLKL
jgi:hypothetical protein